MALVVEGPRPQRQGGPAWQSNTRAPQPPGALASRGTGEERNGCTPILSIFALQKCHGPWANSISSVEDGKHLPNRLLLFIKLNFFSSWLCHSSNIPIAHTSLLWARWCCPWNGSPFYISPRPTPAPFSHHHIRGMSCRLLGPAERRWSRHCPLARIVLSRFIISVKPLEKYSMSSETYLQKVRECFCSFRVGLLFFSPSEVKSTVKTQEQPSGRKLDLTQVPLHLGQTKHIWRSSSIPEE